MKRIIRKQLTTIVTTITIVIYRRFNYYIIKQQ